MNFVAAKQHPLIDFRTDIPAQAIRLTVRRVAGGNLGMNCSYEVADSQGRVPYRNRGQ
jgi:hypothetical protein